MIDTMLAVLNTKMRSRDVDDVERMSTGVKMLEFDAPAICSAS